MIDKPGIYDIPFKEYLADPCPEPSLSRSDIVNMLDQSPKHARALHPRLGKPKLKDPNKACSTGEVAHAILFKSETDRIAVSPFAEFRTDAAKAWKAENIAAGRMVIKEDAYNDAKEMAACFHTTMQPFYKELGEEFPVDNYEKTVVAQIEGVWCRIRIDALGESIWDYKTTGTEYKPEKYCKNQIFELGYNIQAAFYKRVYKAATGIDARFICAVQEQDDPYDGYPIILNDEDLARADERVTWALRQYRRGLDTGLWDGYTKRVVYAVEPPWKIAEWEDFKAREEMVAQIRAQEAA